MNKIHLENKLPLFILFSGHNQRAIISLCRFFYANKIKFIIISNGKNDPIWETKWKRQVKISRIDENIDIEIFKLISKIKSMSKFVLTYCETTEYLNNFVYENKDEIEKLKIRINLPDKKIYELLTNKESSAAIIKKLAKIKTPPRIKGNELTIPFVIKPKKNIVGDKVFYPQIILTIEDYRKAELYLNNNKWFNQKYIDGQSIYFCSYISRNGETAYYWQNNLVQQENGKSIILAKTTQNPGVDTAKLISGLIKLDYHGLFMMEVIKTNRNELYFIEINPRFWGPLQLSLTVCPEILYLYTKDAGLEITEKSNLIAKKDEAWYAWSFGAKNQKKLRVYPELPKGMSSVNKMNDVLKKYDIYNYSDTRKLTGVY
jgi:predicted ATP-grasp superfamily ATP-dependent carboligase